MRVYSIVSATALLLLGVLGFAFGQTFKIPGWLSLANLILGVWGMFVIFSRKGE